MMKNLLSASGDPRIAFEIFEQGVRWYAVIIVIGMLVALATLAFALKRDGFSADFSMTMFLWLVPLAVVFCRLFYVVPREEFYPIDSWDAFINFINPATGGLTIIGGIFGGAIGIVLCAKIHKKSLSRLLDVMPFPLLIAQAIGRWGNYINQELYGHIVKEPSLQWFPFAVEIDVTGQWHYANFFYESMLNLLAFIVLGFLFLKFRHKFKPASFGLMYLFFYPLTRALLDFIKYDPMTLGDGGIGVVQLICFIVAGVSLVLLILNQCGVIRLETKKAYARFCEYSDAVGKKASKRVKNPRVDKITPTQSSASSARKKSDLPAVKRPIKRVRDRFNDEE